MNWSGSPSMTAGIGRSDLNHAVQVALVAADIGSGRERRRRLSRRLAESGNRRS